MQKGFRWLFPTFTLLPKIGQMLIEKSASKKNKKVNSLHNSCTTLSFLFHFFEQLSEGFQQKLIFSSLGTQPEFVEQELNFPCLYFVNVGDRPDKQTKKVFSWLVYKVAPPVRSHFFFVPAVFLLFFKHLSLILQSE
jgi:hypothetical protein